MFRCTNLRTVRGLGTCSYEVQFNMCCTIASYPLMAGVDYAPLLIASLLFVYSVYCAHNAVKGYLYVSSID